MTVVIVLQDEEANALLPIGPVKDPDGCRLCGARSPAHYCHPQQEAEDELRRQIERQLEVRT